ncbi:MAG TPA: ABC transporter permease [Gaiellaceae bacterium]|jgi:peptide/nickel transport system permease protein|nr:ABC transporter permease [Gaiellaceae bacterium]
MGGFLIRRVGAALVVLVLASMLVFLGVRAIPGDPAIALGAENRDPAVLAAIRHKYLLDRPLPVQYVHWISLAVRGDLGTDQRQLSVARTIVTRLPITLELALLSMLVATLVGIPAGVIAAVRRGKPSDYAATAVALVGLSVPHFWLGLLMIVWFAVDLHWLPASGYVSMHHPLANLEHMVMPCLVLGAGFAAVLMRQMRSSMLTSLGTDYVRTARAKGLSELRVVGRHALRNSLITITTVMGLQLGALISGAVITETIFGIAGFGRLTIDAVNQRDYALIQGVVLVAAVGYVIANLLVDLVYSLLNPRIRVG